MDETKKSIGDLSSSFATLKTKKIGRKLSRSVSIVAMVFPEKPSLMRRTSKAKAPHQRNSKKSNRSFELAVIAPDKTQKQVIVNSSQTVSEAVEPILKEFGLKLADVVPRPIQTTKERKSKKSSTKTLVIHADAKEPATDEEESRDIYNANFAVAVLGGSKAPVDPNASASLLDGELLVLQMQAPTFDGLDLAVFLLSEREYASTVASVIELYAKPLLKAEILTKQEYHILFYHLHCVSEASKFLCEILERYMEAGLLDLSQKSPKSLEERSENKSILDELVQEGFLKQSDIESVVSSFEPNKTNSDYDEVDAAFNKPKITLTNHEEITKTLLPFNSLPNKSDMNDNIWLNVQWNFLDKPKDDKSLNASMNDIFNVYDSMPAIVKRSSSDSRILDADTEEGIYESLEDIPSKREIIATPYESIEDLYECIKNQNVDNSEVVKCEQSLYDQPKIIRKDSQRSIKSGTSYTESSVSKESCNIVQGREYKSRIFPKRADSECSDSKVSSAEKDENKIIMNQLINGSLMDVYMDYLSGYINAKTLLREKMKFDEHFPALVDIRKGAAKYTIADYLELPIERLAQYERLAGSGDAGARRRGQRLSDLERVQDLFPNDFLALHEHDVVAATAGTLKSKTLLRKRPSLEAALGASQGAGNGQGAVNGVPPCHPRQFVMEAPCSMAPAPAAPHQGVSSGVPQNQTPSTPTQDRHLFLFTDLLLVAKSRGNNSFKLKEAVRLSEVWTSAASNDTSFLLGWAGSGSPTTYILTYPTQAARDSWLRKIQSGLNTQIGFEPKTTNIQILYKDNASAIEFSKTLSVTPDMTSSMVIRQALQLVQGGVNSEGNTAWGPARDFCLWARTSRDSAPVPLIGCERPHAIQMSRIRQTLSNEEGFDLEHVNSKNNPCGMVFELRKINRSVIKTRTPLKLFRRSSGRLFGVSLARLCPNGGLPAAVLTMLRVVHRRGPHTQGIFRKSANAKALKHLREKVDNAGAAGARCPELDSAPVLLVASLLKDFLRSLPSPLMCDSFYANWISTLNLTPAEKISSMRSLLLKLPKVNYNLLSHFVAILQAIARNSAINLMCPMNLAVCVGPSLLWPNITCETAPKAVPALIESLIINAEILFGPHLHNIFGKGSPEPSASLSLDSGAEESDSLHSVGLSLDSLDLTCTRKEKLSLSRDSGLTLSEDDSNSNGGNSPAPRNGQAAQIIPQAGIQTHQAQRVYAKCYTTESQNVNVNTVHGLPKSTNGKNNIYVKNTEADLYSMKYENVYGTSADVQKTIENQQKIYDSITAQNRYNTNYHDQSIYGTSLQNHNMQNRLMQNSVQNNSSMNKNNSVPSKYLTGFEPEKPPRLGINRNNRNAKVHSVHIEHANEKQHQVHPNKVFFRAKSSDDLLDKRSERNVYNCRGSQENIYGNITYENRAHAMKKVQKNSILDSSKLDPSLQSYSRVYGGWEQRVSNYTNSSRPTISTYSDEKYKSPKQNMGENIYDITPTSSKSIHANQESDQMPTSTIFTRKDWSRQASRTKSLDVAGLDCTYPPGTYPNGENDDNAIYNQVNERSNDYNSSPSYKHQCNIRSIDPSHVCSKKCVSVGDNVEISQKQLNTSRTSSNINVQKYSPASEIKKSSILNKIPRKSAHSSKYDKNNYGGKLVHSKSLANIVLHSDSSSSDTLYQPTNYLKQGSPATSDKSFSHKYTSEYSDDIYGVARRKNDLDLFCENIYGKMGSREGIYSSDIYTAKPTSVKTYSEKSDPNESEKIDYTSMRNSGLAPPVPPRKGSHNNSLKNLPPVHLNGEDRKSRSKSVPSIYQEHSQDMKNHSAMSDGNKIISSGVRAPITSYHLGNSSEKFILALEDSGTDTESESYV